MTNATVDNSPVSIDLAENDSTTVPSGEVWSVTITVFFEDGAVTDTDAAVVKINGQVCIGSYSFAGGSENGGGITNGVVETVLTGGDTILLEQARGDFSDIGAHIGGFVVNS